MKELVWEGEKQLVKSAYKTGIIQPGGLDVDAKEVHKNTQEYMKAKAELKHEQAMRDLRVHGEDSKVKYDPTTGSLKEEK